METLVRPPRTGLEAFEMLPEVTFCQLINDAIIISPAPDLPHVEIQNEIFITRFAQVKKYNPGKVFCAPIDVYLNSQNVYQPDILFVAAARKALLKTQGHFW